MHVHAYLLFCVVLQASEIEGFAGSKVGQSRNKNEDKVDENNLYAKDKSSALKFEKHSNDEIQEKNSTDWFNVTELMNFAKSVSSVSVDGIQKIAYKILLTYNNILNTYTKRAKAISGQMQITTQRLNKLEQDLEDLVEDLHHKYETSELDMKPAVKKLLDKALVEWDKLNRRKESEYSVLQCETVMGRNCKANEDCYGKGCLLQCKASGYLWWRESVCR